MSGEVAYSIKANRTSLPILPQPQLVYVLVEVATASGLAEVRLPINLTLVVDRSQSMCIPILTDEQFEMLARMGAVREVVVDDVPVWQFQHVPRGVVDDAPTNLSFVKIALRCALEELSPQDRFSLVAFARDAHVLVGNEAAASKQRLLSAIERLDGLRLGDETYMARGMAMGRSEGAKALTPDRVQRMLLLTDGFAADGDDCTHEAQQAANQKLAISTLGLGTEFNEDLLISIADLTKGNAYFVHDPQEIPEVFAREMSGVQAITLRNLELKLLLTKGVELRKAFRVRPIISDLGRLAQVEGSLTIPLGDLERDTPQAVLLELIVPPRQAGVYRLAQAILAYDSPVQMGVGEKLRNDLIVQYASTPVTAAPDPYVMNIAERVNAHTLQTRALEEARAGNIAGATVKLKAAYTRLLDMGETDLAEAAHQEIVNLQEQGQVSTAGTKRLRYATRRLID